MERTTFKITGIFFILVFILQSCSEKPNPLQFYNEGNQLLREGKNEEALVKYNEAISITDTFMLVYQNRGVCYSLLKKYDSAYADFQKVLQLDPKNPDAQNNLGLLSEEMGDLNKAVEHFGIAISLAPMNPKHYYNRGCVLYKFKTKDMDEKSLADFNKAEELGFKKANLYYYRSKTLGALAKFEECLVDVDKALQLDSTHTDAMAFKGNVLLLLNKSEEACDCLEKAKIKGNAAADSLYKVNCLQQVKK